MAMDYSGLLEFQKKVQQISNQAERNEFIEGCLKDLAARVIDDTIRLTPTVTGHLKRGWTGGAEMTGADYSKSIPVSHSGNVHSIVVENPVEYAGYVEFGHRQEKGRFVPVLEKRLVKGWVKGKFMLTKGTGRVKRIAPSVLNKRLNKYLQEKLK